MKSLCKFLVVADASRPRQRGGGFHPLLARREAPHNHADQADSGQRKPAAFRPSRLIRRPDIQNHYWESDSYSERNCKKPVSQNFKG